MIDNDNAAASLTPVKSGSVRDRVREALREAIFSGKLAPGDPIREAHLAKALQVSQPTVREALIDLDHAGLVVRSPQRDTIVTRLSAADIRERTRVRVLLESEAAIEAVRRMPEIGFAELEAKLAAIHSGLRNDSYHEYSTADLEFHRTIWRLSGNRHIYKLLDLTTVPLFAFLSIRRSRTLKDLARIVLSHDPILEAMRSGQPEQIREAVRHHLEGSYSGYAEPKDTLADGGNS
jgi:DNA-binding GntR family transcriptional regulator